MPSTKYIIAEQVLYRLFGGAPDVNSPVQIVDVVKKLEQKINAKYKLQQFSVNLPSGETIPENLAIGIYEGIAVSSTTTGKSKATLPVMPISLPKNMGVFQVYEADHPDSPFIPMSSAAMSLLRTDSLLNDLLGQVGYEVKRKEIYFTKDLPINGISEVTIELIVMDMSQYSDTDVLPIAADMEDTLIEELVKEFSPVVPETGQVNAFTGFNQQPQKQ